MSSVIPLVLVEMAVEDTMEKEPMGMRTKNNWRKTILDQDDDMKVESSKCFYRVKT